MQPAEWLIQGCAACEFCDDFNRIRLDLQEWAEAADDVRLVGVEIERVSDVHSLTESLLAQLGQAALWLWPDWYGGGFPLERRSDLDINVNRLCRDRPNVNRQWLGAAAASCRSGRPPLLKRFSTAVQARQLRLALADDRLIVAIFLADPDPSPERLLGLSRVAEWLAREADACVLAVVPSGLSDRPELDAINSGASNGLLAAREDDPVDEKRISGSEGVARPAAKPFRSRFITDSESSVKEGVANHQDTPHALPDARACHPVDLESPRTGGSKGAVEERKHLVCPIVGRPHPASPGEQLLAERLASDEELRDLFGFNQRVETVFENRFLVDLLWPDGRVVIEIDGYGWHSTRSAFNADRERDYELTLSDYLVLRLPHDFVMHDPLLACERIREFVRFRREHPHSQEVKR